MTQPLLLKIYGSLWPTQNALLKDLSAIASTAIPGSGEPCITLTGDLLKIAFEGVYFPLDEVLIAIEKQLNTQQEGKLDKLDLELWQLTRYIFKNGEIKKSSAPLNNVLAYSGH